jgi:hypothetical protein
MFAEMVNMDNETVRQILHDKLNMEGLCKNGPEKPHSGTKRQTQNICSAIMERITEQPEVLENDITCGET